MLKQIKEYVDTLKHDREMLLHKYKYNLTDMGSILESMEESDTNLINHKNLIKILVGKVNSLED